MDDADITGERAEVEMERRLKAAHDFAPEAKACGMCLNCAEPVPDGRRWCDAECREDWELRRSRA